MSHPEPVTDPITDALARRRAEVQEHEASRLHLVHLLAGDVTLDPELLVGLLAATWERLPDLHLVGWKSSTARKGNDTLTEVLAIGAKVGDVLRVYSDSLEEVPA